MAVCAMCSSPERLREPGAALLLLLVVAAPLCAQPGHWGVGSPASPQQIAAWDIDVRPDGSGLPPGQGSVADGEWLYEERCARCHGSFGEGVGGYPALAGGRGSLRDARPRRTVGSYWPHVGTLWDYIHRAMPFTQPESLGDDEVYAIVAYVLFLNDLVGPDFVLRRDNLAALRLPNAGRFIADERPDTANERCMRNCRDPAQLRVRSRAPAYRPAGAVPGGAGDTAAPRTPARDARPAVDYSDGPKP